MQDGRAYIFINYEQALTLGHIGWGFQVDENRFVFGSTDHLWDMRKSFFNPIAGLKFMNVRRDRNNDFWMQSGTEEEMLETMRSGKHVRYHAYKRIIVRNANPVFALKKAHTLKSGGWNVAFNNCVHQSYRVLTAYGAKLLPCPLKLTLSNRVPRKWFHQIKAEQITLQPKVRNILPLVLSSCWRRAG